MYRRVLYLAGLLITFSSIAFGVNCNKDRPIPHAAATQDISVILPLTQSAAKAVNHLFERDLVPSGAHFVGEANTKWEDGGRCMTLLNPYSYIDGHTPDSEDEWDAWTGMGTDGATIPQWAWSIIGGPFEGRYRNAAVVHDAACLRQDRTWEASADMFYDAMRTGGVGWVESHLMYAAVAWFGPKWTTHIRVKQAASSTSDQIRANLRAHNITMSDVSVVTQLARDGSGLSETVVTISPPARVYTYTAGDFLQLKQALDEEYREHPEHTNEKNYSGSITRNTIKNWPQLRTGATK